MDATDIGIGSEMVYSDTRGRSMTGVVINIEPAELTNIRTGERFTAKRFYLWSDAEKRGMWTCAMRPTVEQERVDVS